MINKLKENKLYLIIAIIVLLIILYFGYKGLMLYKYTYKKPDTVEDVVKGLKNYNTIKITKKNLNDNEYITKKNFKMKNIMDGYTLDETISSGGIDVYRKEIDGQMYAIQFGPDEAYYQLVSAFVEDDITLFGEDNGGFLKGSINDADRKGFLEKNNIKNDIDFYKFVADNYYIENNIFTDTKTMKQNYAFNFFTAIAVPQIKGWTILEGDITGYIMYVGTKDEVSVYEITILDNDKRYGILTNDPRFSDQSFMEEIISTIEIVK